MIVRMRSGMISTSTVISMPPRKKQSRTLQNYLDAVRDVFETMDCSNLTADERSDLFTRMPSICAFITYPREEISDLVMRVSGLSYAQRSKLILWLTLSRSKPLLDGAEQFLAGGSSLNDTEGYYDFDEARRISDIFRRLLDYIISRPHQRH